MHNKRCSQPSRSSHPSIQRFARSTSVHATCWIVAFVHAVQQDVQIVFHDYIWNSKLIWLTLKLENICSSGGNGVLVTWSMYPVISLSRHAPAACSSARQQWLRCLRHRSRQPAHMIWSMFRRPHMVFIIFCTRCRMHSGRGWIFAVVLVNHV